MSALAATPPPLDRAGAVRGSRILLIDDDPQIRQSLRLCLEVDDARISCVATGAGAIDSVERGQYDLAFLDLWLGQENGMALVPELLRRRSDLKIIVITAYPSMESAIEALKAGAADYITKPFTPDQVRQAARRQLMARQLAQQMTDLQRQVDAWEQELTFATRSPAYAMFLDRARRAAQSEASLLIGGESGTGKTVLARWMHRLSRRAAHPFVTVHCPMLTTELMSSTLFGHRRGAFTGAVDDSLGKVAEAEGGTLFLDEVADLSGDAQARLLRFLNDRTYERVGEARERQADVRLIAATNHALEVEVASGAFREDLYHRLHVIPLVVPALRERREDVLDLAGHYRDAISRQQGTVPAGFDSAAQAAILAHPWPGNLRELRNAIERAVILSTSSEIAPGDLGLMPGSPLTGAVRLGDAVPLEAIEREHIARVVASQPTLDAAARVLGIDATTLARKRRRYGLA